MEYQQAVVRAPRMSRINWTQTTTITIAAFIGCLAALALLVVVYRSFLAKSHTYRLAKLERIENQIHEAENELADLKFEADQGKKRIVRPPVIEQDDEDTEPVDATPKGEKIATTPAV
ncbi:hypothetical protein GO755_33510 [Spirosoma sp. HMF4905]|uniref:Uncharacterized protein n=1 Tax=Spirosoma arboris TaxID=2682092 RepID=A0A7K1SMH7_9BACT|nr:hypothetical protein [Spirosoma arboris]MVM34994.1 hypothetical protein [Spirosoma arboris]